MNSVPQLLKQAGTWYSRQTRNTKLILWFAVILLAMYSGLAIPTLSTFVVLFPILAIAYLTYRLRSRWFSHPKRKSIISTIVIIAFLLNVGWVAAFASLFGDSQPQLSRNKNSNPTPTTTPVPTTEPTIKPSTEQQQALENNDTNKSPLYSVIKVVDGDTLAVDIDGTNTTLRLIGIDTPETVDPRKPVQCFGVEASNKAKEMLTAKSVRLEADPTQGDRDKYNRLLRYVWLEDGTDFNKLMISEGYAFEYTYNIPYKYQAEYQQAENDARENQRGLWADDTCAGVVEVQPTNTPVQPTSTQTPTPAETNSAPVVTEPTATSTSVPPTNTPVPQQPVSDCDCNSGNTLNCTDFSTHTVAQACFEKCGGIDNDVHRLDGNNDGVACESLP